MKRKTKRKTKRPKVRRKAVKARLSGKRWESSFEEPIRKAWRNSEPFKFNHKKSGGVFSIDTPPPYVNAPVWISLPGSGG
jgi:valyl-tRNA synthetase